MKKLALFLALAAAGCATTSAVLQPEVVPPPAYEERAAEGASVVTPEWWKRFDSSELASLVEEALAVSPDLAIAAERVRQAEAQVRVAGASLFPSLDLGFDTRKNRDFESSSTSLSARYEVDLFGRNAAGVRGAQFGLRATAFDRDAVRLTLLAGVANSYFEVLSLRSRLTLSRENLEIAERVLALVRARAKAGAVSPLDVARQEATVLSQRAALLSLEQQERQTLAALAVLVGRLPEGFRLQAQTLADLGVPAIEPGLPSELLLRRPDLAAAEASLLAANADLSAARAALLPSIQLTASAGVASGSLLAVLSGSSTGLSLAASVLQPIFDGGRLKGRVDIAASRERELVETYRAAILDAFADVEIALAAASRLAARETLLVQVEERAREALRLAEVRYREGADDLLSVLDAQRSLFDAQDQLSLVRRDRLQAAVSLFRALGGGWSA